MTSREFVRRGQAAQAAVDARTVRDPQTPAEWQDAVDGAEACLLVDSARQYGLVVGGPRGIDVARCEEILARGRAQGCSPIRSGVDAYIHAFAGRPR